MSATKVDFKRELRELYTAGREPELVDVPELAFIMIDGHGDPNTSPAYTQAVEALYTVAYTAKFALARGADPFDFAVMPLEGLWWVPDMTRFASTEKSDWDWTMMIMQPDRVSGDVFADARAAAAEKKSLEAIARVRLERFAEGRAAQVMHVGPYGAEGPTIAGLHAFIAEQGCAPAGKHHEIYLSDPRRAAPEKLKTIVRQPLARPG
ncbi:MAG TPA: GyrI-like domain-containing protein [Solirubrobacteraceae bacterium]